MTEKAAIWGGDDLLEAGLSQFGHDRRHIVCQLPSCS